MRTLFAGIGIVAFWLLWPVWFVYFPLTKRTRLLLICGDKILVQKAWLGMGKWSLPGGGLHRRENVRVGLLREVREETGLTLSPRQVKPLVSSEFRYFGLHFMCHYFVTEVPEVLPTKSQLLEIRAQEWHNRAEHNKRNSNPDILTALKAYHKT